MPQENATITLGAREYKLEAPASFVARREILELTQTAPARAIGAAIGLCCPKLARKLNVSTAGLPLEYGQRMYDAIAAQGYEGDIVEAGRAALALIVSSLPTPKGIEDAEGNSEAQPVAGI